MPIQIIAVGKQREPFFRDAAMEYQRRLSRYVKLTMVEVQDEKDPGASPALIARALDTEGERILERIAPRDRVVALCIEGEQMDSGRFSELVKAWQGQADPVGFVVGGSLGLSPAVLKRADLKLSFSMMTFPHQLARVLLLEQVYRAYKILSGERYHK